MCSIVCVHRKLTFYTNIYFCDKINHHNSKFKLKMGRKYKKKKIKKLNNKAFTK